jgi:hypothetical protein
MAGLEHRPAQVILPQKSSFPSYFATKLFVFWEAKDIGKYVLAQETEVNPGIGLLS